MKILRILCPLLASAALLAAQSATAADVPQTIVEDIGGVDFTLPVPSGFAPPAATPPAMHDMMVHALPATNRLLTVMLTQPFLNDLAKGVSTTGRSRYLAVQSFTPYEQSGVSPAMFQQVKTMFRNQSAQLIEKSRPLLDESTARVSEDVGKLTGDKAASIKADDQHLLGVFDDQADSISVGAVQSLSVAARDRKVQMKQAMAMTMVLLRGKVLLVTFYSADDSQADIDWVEDQARAWNRRVHELNP